VNVGIYHIIKVKAIFFPKNYGQPYFLLKLKKSGGMQLIKALGVGVGSEILD
jgi:hypothetical protein